MSDHGDRGGRNSEMKLVCCKSWGFGTHPNGGVCFRGVNPPYRSLKWHKVSFAHLWVAQATLRNQERNSHATHGSWFDRVNRDEAVVLLQTAHRKVPFSWLIQHHSLGSLLLLSRVATPKILLCCDIFSRGSAIHGRQIVATRPSSCLQRNWHAMNTYRCSRYELRKNQTSVRNSFVRACHRCYMLCRLHI